MIDFDLAKMLPGDMKREDCRLPSYESFVGSYGPADTSQGEFEYNPFVYDVGSLGVMFCDEYQVSSRFQGLINANVGWQHYTKDIPLLAPFLDRMVTKNLQRRFTAAEGLRFVERIILESKESQLSTSEYRDPEYGLFTFETYDRWKSLPADFQMKWSAYREPVGIPFSSKILRAIVASVWLPEFLIPKIRKMTFKVLSIPRGIWAQCFRFASYLRE